MVQIKSSVILRFYFYAMHSLILILLLSTSYRRYFIFSRFARFRPAKRVDDTHTYSRLHARSAKTVLTFRNIGTLDSFSFSFLLSLSLFLFLSGRSRSPRCHVKIPQNFKVSFYSSRAATGTFTFPYFHSIRINNICSCTTSLVHLVPIKRICVLIRQLYKFSWLREV